MKKALYISLLFSLLATISPQGNAQTFEELSKEEQMHFFEGYWKYNSLNKDTIFIIKFKMFKKENGFYTVVGSYLYYENKMIENNIDNVNQYLNLAFNQFEDFFLKRPNIVD